MCVLIFSTTLIWNISHSKKNLARYCHKCENVFIQTTRYSCQILIKLKFSRQLIEKEAQMSRFIKIRLVEAELFFADRRTDRRDETNSRFSRL
jgi:hypothetical protein